MLRSVLKNGQCEGSCGSGSIIRRSSGFLRTDAGISSSPRRGSTGDWAAAWRRPAPPSPSPKPALRDERSRDPEYTDQRLRELLHEVLGEGLGRLCHEHVQPMREEISDLKAVWQDRLGLGQRQVTNRVTMSNSVTVERHQFLSKGSSAFSADLRCNESKCQRRNLPSLTSVVGKTLSCTNSGMDTTNPSSISKSMIAPSVPSSLNRIQASVKCSEKSPPLRNQTDVFVNISETMPLDGGIDWANWQSMSVSPQRFISRGEQNESWKTLESWQDAVPTIHSVTEQRQNPDPSLSADHRGKRVPLSSSSGWSSLESGQGLTVPGEAGTNVLRRSRLTYSRRSPAEPAVTLHPVASSRGERERFKTSIISESESGAADSTRNSFNHGVGCMPLAGAPCAAPPGPRGESAGISAKAFEEFGSSGSERYDDCNQDHTVFESFPSNSKENVQSHDCTPAAPCALEDAEYRRYPSQSEIDRENILLPWPIVARVSADSPDAQ